MTLPPLFVTNRIPQTHNSSKNIGKSLTILLVFNLVGCDYFTKPKVDNTLSIEKIANAMPNRNQDKTAWANDIYDIFNTLKIERNKQNICSAIAIIDQESNFKADPPVPNLGKTSLNELNSKLDEKLGKILAGYFRNMLKNEPTPQNSFEKQILAVQTEQQLDKIYHQMFLSLIHI